LGKALIGLAGPLSRISPAIQSNPSTIISGDTYASRKTIKRKVWPLKIKHYFN
jgi:hypothetical protein